MDIRSRSVESLVNMQSKFWKNKRVLVTGYEGFLGSNLTKKLLGLDARVFGLDVLIHRKQTILTEKDLNKVKIIKGSVENLSLLNDIIKANKIGFIFHLAAKSLVGYCLQNPLKTFSTNIKGTWNILEASRNSDLIKAVVVASSDKAYGSHIHLPYKENTPLQGAHPYDASKSCADLIAYTYFHTYGIPVSVTRCGNIFGQGDFNFSRIIPDTIKSIIQNKRLIIRSDGKFTRDYIYVEDIVNGYLILAEKSQRLKLAGEAFNFSYSKPISVLNLVKKLYRIAGKKANYKVANQAKCEIKDQYLSSQKSKEILKWKPEYTLETGLKKTLEWYRVNLKC